MRFSWRLELWLGAALLITPAGDAGARGALSDAESRMVAAIDRRIPPALELLEASVNLNSGTMNFEGVRRTGALFQPHFEALGFKVRWIDGTPWGRAGHLVAERIGRAGGPKLLLIGHLDTVFEPDSPFQRFERLTDSTARGPGVIDMKGGNVVMLLALQALTEAGAIERLSFRVVLTGDEEKIGSPLALARRDLVEAAEWAEIAIGFEDGAGDPRTAVIARRGAENWILRTSGRPAHSSQIFRPGNGSGAIYEQARILSVFHDSLSGEPYLTVNPGVGVGGTAITFEVGRGTASGKTNVIAESTAVAGDLRTVSPEQLERTRDRMRRIVSAHLPLTGAEIVFEEGYPPMAPSRGNQHLLGIYDTASRDLGFGAVEAVDPSRAGAADVSFIASRVNMAIDGVGLMGEGGHTVSETADLATLSSQAKRMAVTLLRLATIQVGRPPR